MSRGPSVEILERRAHFALMTFTIDPAVSSLRLSGDVQGIFNLHEQRSGSLVAAYEGSILVDVGDGAVTFPGGSNVAARATRRYEPGPGFANYGGEEEVDSLFGDIVVGEAAIRKFAFDLRSPELALSEGGGLDASGLDVHTTGGTLQYGLRFAGGELDLDGKTLNNRSTGSATLRGDGGNRTLTIPLDFNLAEDDTDLRLRGTLVAITGTGAPRDLNTVRIGDGSLFRTAQFTDADGTLATVTLTGGGSAEVRFADATQQTTGKAGTTVVAGAGLQFLGIDVTGTNARTKLAIAGKGGADRVVTVPSLITDASAASIGGKGVAFTGPVTIGGALGALAATRLTSATVTADSIGTIKVGGDVTGSTITLDAPFAPGTLAVRSVAVSGTFGASRLSAVGRIGPVKVGTMSGGEIYSGVSGTAARFPAATDLLPDAGAVGNVTARTFADSVIAADTLGRVKIGTVATANAGNPFGLTADVIGGLQAANEAREKVKLALTDDPAALAAALAAQPFAPGDFAIRLV